MKQQQQKQKPEKEKAIQTLWLMLVVSPSQIFRRLKQEDPLIPQLQAVWETQQGWFFKISSNKKLIKIKTKDWDSFSICKCSPRAFFDLLKYLQLVGTVALEASVYGLCATFFNYVSYHVSLSKDNIILLQCTLWFFSLNTVAWLFIFFFLRFFY